MIEDGTKEKNLKKDNAPVKRVERRAHTMMSQLDRSKDLFERAKNYGMKAVAVTDLGVVQSFPDAMNVSRKNRSRSNIWC